MQSARALAKTLAGDRTVVSYPVLPVIVKHPLVPWCFTHPGVPKQVNGRLPVSKAI